MKIVVKVGTQSIISSAGEPLLNVIESIVSQITQLIENGHNILLVSSGAVGLGKGLVSNNKHCLIQKKLLASIGQHELMHIYSKMFKKHNLLVSQILLTKNDFKTRKNYLNIADLLRDAIFHNNIIPIINENDTTSSEDSMFSDNDELAGILAAQINADQLIILSNIEGVFSKNPSLEGACLLENIDPNFSWPSVSSDKNLQGRGGMITKLNNAKKMSNLGIATHIASANQKNVLIRIANKEPVGTKVSVSKCKSNIKKWLAYSVPNGKIYADDHFCLMLKDKYKALSLLPVAVNLCTDFKKGDVVEIINDCKETVALGVAKYDSNILKEFLGHKNKPEIINHDYLYVL